MVEVTFVATASRIPLKPSDLMGMALMGVEEISIKRVPDVLGFWIASLTPRLTITLRNKREKRNPRVKIASI